jgi:hypothetical protein
VGFYENVWYSPNLNQEFEKLAGGGADLISTEGTEVQFSKWNTKAQLWN